MLIRPIACALGALLLAVWPAAALAQQNAPAPPPAVRGNFSGRTDRPLRYTPDHGDFVIESRNGQGEFFNRPLYGSNTAFRVDAGDLPEFMFYLPTRGGNLRLGIRAGTSAKWLHAAEHVFARYHDGMMIYRIEDALMGGATLTLTAVPLQESEGLILQVTAKGTIPPGAELLWAAGGSDGLAGSRRGDIGTESAPVRQFFQLTPENCRGNQITASDAAFSIAAGTRRLSGVVSGAADAIRMVTADAALWDNPGALLVSGGNSSAAPILFGHAPLTGEARYLLLQHPSSSGERPPAVDLPGIFESAMQSRERIASAITFDTPDPYINAAAPALAIAADACWDESSGTVMHGAVAWRNRLLGWRGPYAMDELGWHDRMMRHLTYWAGQQVTDENIPKEPHADPKKNLAADDWTMLHSNGAMSKSHYDMNLAYIDAYIRHALWTGDMELLRKTWPVLERHIAWEQRCFRRLYTQNNEPLPLYEAYAAIWASDNLQYNGAGTAHASALNFYHNTMIARIARILGKDPGPYEKEAAAILQAMNRELWLPQQGIFAEYKDLFATHTASDDPAVWTFYHTLDSGAADPFQAYQMSRFVDRLARIPMRGAGIAGGAAGGGQIVATSNWMPYMWSLNKFCLGENAATALAYFQANRPEAAFSLLKGNILDSMFMGLCPGNCHMASQFDPYRGESQRDFADPTAMMLRALVEGLFGVQPDLLTAAGEDGQVTIKPGFPASWEHAAISHPDFAFSDSYGRDRVETISFAPHFPRPVGLHLILRARLNRIVSLRINGQAASWKPVVDAINVPEIEITAAAAPLYEVEILWDGQEPVSSAGAAIPGLSGNGSSRAPRIVIQGQVLPELAGTSGVKDPQGLFLPAQSPGGGRTLDPKISGQHTFFIQMQSGGLTWWAPVDLDIRPPFEFLTAARQDPNGLRFVLRNNTAGEARRWVPYSGTRLREVRYPPPPPAGTGASGEELYTADNLLPGTNPITLTLSDDRQISGTVTNWKLPVPPATKFETVDLSGVLNAHVAQIFKADYLSPRSPYVSLSIPKQGFGGWADNNKIPPIDDSGVRAVAARDNDTIRLNGIPFRTPATGNNIAFVSFWDNHPKSLSVALSGSARHLYLLMAGTTNPLRSHMENGAVSVAYADGSRSTLSLRNPETWWPIDQDYLIDDYSFAVGQPPAAVSLPPRLDLRTAQFRILDRPTFAGHGGPINGGAATVLDLPLDPAKKLQSLELKPSTYEVIIGLMSATLVR